MKKGCELCGKRGGGGGMMYCEADSARLCWDCDSRVHGANFLVAKHTRVLLCHACHAPTPWMASGSSLPSALSLCPACHVAKDEEEEEEESRIGGGEGYSWSSDDGDEEDEGCEGEGENQVVPWSPVRATAAADGGSSEPPPASSSSSEDDGGVLTCGGLKRVRRFRDDDGGGGSDLDDGSEGETSSIHSSGGGPGRKTSHLEGRPPLRKQPRTVLEETQPQDQTCGGQSELKSTADIIKRLRSEMSTEEEETASARIQNTDIDRHS